MAGVVVEALGMIEGLIIYGIISVLMGAAMWLYRKDEKEVKELAPIDPIEVEARRLAEREVAELDWRCGTGPEPEWLKPPKPVVEETLIEKYTHKIENAMGVTPIILKGDPSQTRFVKTVEEVAELAELAARDAERRGIIKEIVPGSDNFTAREWKVGDPPLPPEATRYVVKNALGQVLYEYEEDGVTVYPRPRKTPRPAPPLTNKARRG